MSSPTSASAFVPRPYPPPSLAGVPNEYILSRLHHLAPHYWNKPETADCTIGKHPFSYTRPSLPGAHLITVQSSMMYPRLGPLPKESEHPSLESPSRSVFLFSFFISSWISLRLPGTHRLPLLAVSSYETLLRRVYCCLDLEIRSRSPFPFPLQLPPRRLPPYPRPLLL